MKKFTWWFTFSKEGRTITRQLSFTLTPHGHCYVTFPDLEVAKKELYADYLELDLNALDQFGAKTSGENYTNDMSWVRFQRVREDLAILRAVVFEITP